VEGIDPQWRGDGRELFVIGADQQLMALPVTTEGGFRAGTPAALFLTNLDPMASAFPAATSTWWRVTGLDSC
jgi:hypothetical protein